MDKIKIQRKPFENVTFDFEGQTVEVKPFMSFAEKSALAESYIKTMFLDFENNTIVGETDRIRAEYQLMINVLGFYTNIDVTDIDVVSVYVEDLFRKVTDNIKNYFEFECLLMDIVEDYRKDLALKHSVGKVVEELSEKAMDVLSKFSELTPESINELATTTSNLIKEAREISNPADSLLEKT